MAGTHHQPEREKDDDGIQDERQRPNDFASGRRHATVIAVREPVGSLSSGPLRPKEPQDSPRGKSIEDRIEKWSAEKRYQERWAG